MMSPVFISLVMSLTPTMAVLLREIAETAPLDVKPASSVTNPEDLYM